MTNVCFLRVDHPSLKKIVDSLGDNVTDGDLEAIAEEVVNLTLPMNYGLGYELCKEGSEVFKTLSNDARFVKKIYIPNSKN